MAGILKNELRSRCTWNNDLAAVQGSSTMQRYAESENGDGASRSGNPNLGNSDVQGMPQYLNVHPAGRNSNQATNYHPLLNGAQQGYYVPGIQLGPNQVVGNPGMVAMPPSNLMFTTFVPGPQQGFTCDQQQGMFAAMPLSSHWQLQGWNNGGIPQQGMSMATNQSQFQLGHHSQSVKKERTRRNSSNAMTGNQQLSLKEERIDRHVTPHTVKTKQNANLSNVIVLLDDSDSESEIPASSSTFLSNPKRRALGPVSVNSVHNRPAKASKASTATAYPSNTAMTAPLQSLLFTPALSGNVDCNEAMGASHASSEMEGEDARVDLTQRIESAKDNSSSGARGQDGSEQIPPWLLSGNVPGEGADFGNSDPFAAFEDDGSTSRVDPVAAYPKTFTLTTIDMNGDKSGTIVVTIEKEAHDPTSKTPEELSRRIVVAISLDGKTTLEEGIIRSCIHLHWDDRDVADLAVDRVLNLLSAEDFPPGFDRNNIGPWLGLSRQDFALWLCSNLEPYQSLTVYRSGGDQNEHIVSRGSPMFQQADLLMNLFRAKWHFTNTMIEHRLLNIDKHCHHVNADEMVLISEDGSRMSARSFNSSGGEPHTNFSHWEHRPQLVNEDAESLDLPLTVSQANAIAYREQSQQYKKALSEMTSMDGNEYIQYIVGCINDSLCSARFGSDKLTEIIKKYSPKVLEFLKNERPDLSLPNEVNLLKEVHRLGMIRGGSNGNDKSAEAVEVPSAGVTAVTTAAVDDDLSGVVSLTGADANITFTAITAAVTQTIQDMVKTVENEFTRRLNSTRLIERVEEKRNERSISIPTSPVLVIGNCDIFSPLIDKLSALPRGECSVHEIELTICKLAKVLQFRVKAIGEARNIQMHLIEEDYDTVLDLSIAPLSDVLNVMKEAEKDKDEEERSSPYSRAAETAAAEAIEDLMSRGQKTTKKTWLRMCPLGQKVKVLVYRAAQLLAVCRVLQMMPFVDFLDTATTDKKFKKKVFSAIAGISFDFENEKLDCASVLEIFIIPSLQISAPEENKQLCFDLLVLMTSIGTNKNEFRSYFEQSEIIPMTEVYKDCSDEDIERYKANSASGVRHLSLDTKRGQTRRRESMRGFLYSLTMPRLQQILAKCNWKGQDIEMVSRGILCAPASNFSATKYGFLHKKGILNPSEEFIASMLKKGGPVDDLMKRGTDTLKELRDDFVFVDLTDDVNNDTDECLSLLRGYFEEADAK